MTTPQRTIPRPIGQRWRDIRLRHVPLLVYVTGIIMVVYLWNTHWMPSAFVGEVQADIANVASLQDGTLAGLSVEQFDRVARGQILGRVDAQSPGAASAAFAGIRADLQIMRARMILDQRRNIQNYQQLRVDQLERKVDLAIARSNLRFAESELLRNERLRAENIVSQFEYESALDYRDALATGVKEQEQLIAEMDQTLAGMKPVDAAGDDPLILDTIEVAIQNQEEQFRQAEGAVLRSPMDGVVTQLYRKPGENISAGEPLIAVSSDQSDSIIGYVRQPISFEPKVGDVVVVRSRRGNQRLAAEARVIRVGARLELFTQPLRVRGLARSQERGLPVLITVPQDLALYPGELVDLAWKN